MKPSEPNAVLNRAQDFIWRNARLLERRRFSFLFEGGEREPVLTALKAYQNADGGFGNALEPDKRTPHSQPVDAEVALHVLDLIGFDDETVRRLCDFLMTITTPEGGIPYALPSVRDYPRTPWWDAPDDPPASINPTAAILGLLIKHGVRHPWIETASAYCRLVIDTYEEDEVHALLCIYTFLEHAPDRDRAKAAFRRISERMPAKGLVALDPADTSYVKKPLDWAPTPQSLCRRLFADDVIDRHLDALAAQQGEDGGWPIAWASCSLFAETEWRGMATLNALRTLRAYGRLD